MSLLNFLAGQALALPSHTAFAQQQMPLVGFLNSASPDTYRFNADSFREGLAKAGFIEGRNVRIVERWAQGDYEALPALAAELVAAAWLPLPPPEMSLLRAQPSVRAARCPWFLRSAAIPSALDW